MEPLNAAGPAASGSGGVGDGSGPAAAPDVPPLPRVGSGVKNGTGALTSNSSSLNATSSLKICNVLSAAELIEDCAELMVRVGVRRMHQTCPDLTLTIAAMERMLYFYILDLLVQYHQNQTQMSLMPSKMVSHASLEQENPTLRNISGALRDALPKLEHSRRLQKAFPAPAGGMRSLLYYLTTTLKATKACLENLDHHFNGRGRRSARDGRGSERPGPAAKIVGATALAGLAAGAAKKAAHQPQAVAIAKQLASSAHRHTDNAATRLNQHLSQHGVKLTHNQSLAIAIGAVPVAAASVLGLCEWRTRSKLGFRLNECQFSLNVVMRLWTLVMNVVHSEKVRRVQSYHSLMLAPSQFDDDTRNQPTSRKLVERVPIPSTHCFWYDSQWQIALFKRGMDIMYASASEAGFYWDHLGRMVGVPVMVAYSLYYAVCSHSASSRAAIALQEPSSRFIRRAWGVLDLPIVRQGSHLVAYAKGLRYQKHFVCAGIKCHMYASRPPPTDGGKETEGGPPWGSRVLFYVHGGAFIASLHAADMFALTKWARETGCVVIFPEYGLAPESPFPTGLNQLVDVWEAVCNGLVAQVSGMDVLGAGSPNYMTTPASMTLVGESAGGNLAAALAVKLIQLKLRKPDGLCLAYPCLNLSSSPGPSRIVHSFDPILPLGIMYAVLETYAGLHKEVAFGAEKSPTMSPYHTPDNLLEHFPRTHIMAGGFDPLLDDSVDFNTRLQRMGVQSTLEVQKGLPHGFVGLCDFVPAAMAAVHNASRFLGESFHRVDGKGDHPDNASRARALNRTRNQSFGTAK